LSHSSDRRTDSRLAWIISGSLILGLASAVFLVAVPLGGARENVITAGVLLASALGWTSLAVLSTAWTDLPQRWAAVPAILMTLVAMGLIVWPGAVEESWIAWSWPVAALVLVLWMVAQARRHLRGRGSGFVYSVVTVMALGAIAGFTECVWEAHDRRAIPMSGQLIDVGRYRLHLNTVGDGSPTVVLFSGAGDLSAEWGWITPAVARDCRVCTFDRAGRGWSDSAPGPPQDGVAVVTDLHSLLERAHVPGPYVLAGHSFGGLYALVFAARYPGDVAGVVLLDSTHPDMFTRIAAYPAFYEGYRRVSAIFPSLGRLAVGRVAYLSQFDALPIPARREEYAFWSTARLARSQRDEWAEAPVLMNQAGRLKSLGDRPLMVLTAGRDAVNGWMPLQNELASLSTNSVHRVLPRTTHNSLIYERDQATFAIQAISDVVQAVRLGRPLAK